MKSGTKQKPSNKSLFLPVKAEYLFLILAAVFGLFFVFTNPPWQTNDEDRHFIHSYYISHGFLIPDQGDNKIGGEIPVNIVELPQKFQGIRFSETLRISKLKLEEAEKVKLNKNNKQFYHDHSYSVLPVGYIPPSLGIFFGQFIQDNPVWLNWWGRMGSLAFYIVIIFFAIRIIPIFKNVLFLYALTPMCIYQGASVTYDALNISLTFLLFAITIKYAIDDTISITWKEFGLLIGLLIIHRLSKDGYPLIPLALFLIPPRKFKIQGNWITAYASILIVSYILYYLPEWTWSKILQSQHYHIETPIRLQKDLVGSLPENLKLNINNPGMAASNIIDNINHFRQEWTGGTIGRFGYSYTLMPNWFFLIHGLIIMAVAFSDSSKNFIVKLWQKGIAFGIGSISILGIIFMSYLYSPIGANQVFGLQGRYFVNLIPFLLLTLYSNKVEFRNWKKWGSLAVAGYIILTLIYTLFYLDNIFYSTP